MSHSVQSVDQKILKLLFILLIILFISFWKNFSRKLQLFSEIDKLVFHTNLPTLWFPLFWPRLPLKVAPACLEFSISLSSSSLSTFQLSVIFVSTNECTVMTELTDPASFPGQAEELQNSSFWMKKNAGKQENWDRDWTEIKIGRLLSPRLLLCKIFLNFLETPYWR